jgi:predicted enzyme related to lactoylglutathione lyase
MGNPVVHFEIIGADPAALREYYGALFGWKYTVGDATTDTVSDQGQYGFVEADPAAEFPGIPGGVAGGPAFERRVLFYVGVPNVAEALDQAERLGGTRLMGPEPKTDAEFAVGHFADPEGNVVGVAGPSRIS